MKTKWKKKRQAFLSLEKQQMVADDFTGEKENENTRAKADKDGRAQER